MTDHPPIPKEAIQTLAEFVYLIETGFPKIWMSYSDPENRVEYYRWNSSPSVIGLTLLGAKIAPKETDTFFTFNCKDSPNWFAPRHAVLHFPTSNNQAWFAFKNYWHAYAYSLQQGAKNQ